MPETVPLFRPLAALLIALLAPLADDKPPRPEGPLTKALKRVPADRQGTVIDMIGKRGTSADLDALFERLLVPGDFADASRVKALAALAEAAQTRDMLPAGNPSRLASLLDAKADPATRLAAVKLAGLWKARGLTKNLKGLAGSPDSDDALRSASFEALATIGGPEARDAITALTAIERPPAVRAEAIAALVRIDLDDASERAGVFLRAPGSLRDLTPLVSAFLNRQGGSDKLAQAIDKVKVPADPARLALRAVYTLGRSDQGLVASLTKAAGLTAEVKPLDKVAMDRMVADVGSKGKADRGELVFRRPELGCVNCHALSGAGGGVGPDLSAVGSSSPVDYIVNSIMLPDQAIKEQYQTLVVQTADGQVFHGIVADKDDKRVVLREAAGTLRTVATSDIDESKEGGSLMPKGLVNFLTRADFLDLVKFLSELGKPGPYAVRTTPTIQRWRFLKPVPVAMFEASPDPESFRTDVLKAGPSRWAPAYAKLAGDLPLADLTKEADSPVLYLQGEIDVSHGDKVQVRLDAPEGVTAWLDDEPIPPFTGPSVPLAITTGHHALTFRVDTRARTLKTFRAEVLKPAGSSAEYSLVGGR